ncbi:EAL domain-containing protein [Massilia sp. 9096]|uniref:EAL domain-containing protein n=1 Tax=Massilia sp. 9096 TaxID=1500894 RepID=UPI000B09E383|nr:EAL domain-containing protein [Massilia sp. 9096]
MSLIALVTWQQHYVSGGDEELGMQVLAAKVPLSPAQAALQLSLHPPVESYDTQLSEAPVWFGFTAHAFAQEAGQRGGQYRDIEFPSRHAIDMACWDGRSLAPLGDASRAGAHGAMVAVKSGFALRLPAGVDSVLCRAGFVGPAHLTVLQWPDGQLEKSVQQFHRKSGLLDGGMIVLTVFILLTALINRQVVYVQFAGWLILNLRVGALSAGWDTQWLGQAVPHDWLLPLRAVTIALYAMSSVTLYQTLFGAELSNTRFGPPLRVLQWLCLPLPACALVLRSRVFLPLMWSVAAFGLSLMTLGLAASMLRSRNRVAMWFAASFAVTFLSSLAEVVAAAFGMREIVDVINSVTAALASGLLAALAVAEQMRIETEKRRQAQEKLQQAFEAMPVGLFTLDMYGHFLSANPALREMLGASVITPGQSSWKHYFADSVWLELHEKVHMQGEAEMHIANRDASRRFMVSATLARGRIEAMLQDVTEKYQTNEQLRFMADNDPLTKVFNRRGVERMFGTALQALGAGKPLALAYIGLDRLELINDLFGHAAGDQVLKQVCERMALTLAGDQRIGRVGGGEFVIVMPDTALPLATLICRGTVERIGGAAYRVGDKAFQVRGSVGLIEVRPGMALADALSTAERACREAKSGHGDGLVVYERDASAFRERAAELDLVERLDGPNPTDGMFLEMQPIMSLVSPHESLDVEVLLRMREPDGRTVPAGRLIAAAEQSGRMSVIDRWVLSATLAWIEDNLASLRTTRFVCVNLSGASLNDERFVRDALEILARYAHVTNRLCMEVTESVALHDLDNTRRFIGQVRKFGVKVALADFGAGWTSFSYLKEVPADVLKIDGSLIVDISADPAKVAIVEAIVSLAANLGMKTIAERAADAATVRTLVEIGVDYVQGHAIARAQPPEKLPAAGSSASFIKSDEVLQLVRTLGAPANEPGLSPITPLRGSH